MSASSDRSRRKSNFVQHAAWLLCGNLLSRLLGLVRDLVLAARFARRSTDVFFVAFTIPNSLRALLAEGAMSAAFVPLLSEAVAKEGHAEAQTRFRLFVGLMLTLSTVVAALGIVGAPLLVYGYAAGYGVQSEKFALTVQTTRWLFLYLPLIAWASVSAAALHSQRRFIAAAFAPLSLNVALVTAAWWPTQLSPWRGDTAILTLAVAAVLGGVLHFGLLLPALGRAGFAFWPHFAWRAPIVQRARGLLIPLLAGLSVYQVNVMLSRLFASFLPDGAQSYLYYGQRLAEIPQGMLAVAVAQAVMPELSAAHASGDASKLAALLGQSLGWVLYLALPASFFLLFCAEPTVTTLFGRGQFGPQDVAECARSLRMQALGVCGVAASRTVVPLYHASGDTRTPVRCSALNLVIFAAAAPLAMGPLDHAGIALATSLAAWTQLGALLWGLRRRLPQLPWRSLLGDLLRPLLSAALVMATVAWWMTLGHWSAGGNHGRNLLVFAAGALLALGLYLPLSGWLGCTQPRLLRARLGGKLQQGSQRR
ncbi:MAG: murein biosynthesis integral membrane protein MurJ [Polyangiales bacterium]